jgi:hypothetical protein
MNRTATQIRKPWRWTLAFLALICAIFAVNASQARAGTYRVYECNPNLSPSLPDVRTTGNVDQVAFWVDCSALARGISLRGWYPTGPMWAGAYVEAPPTTYFKNVAFDYFHGKFAGFNSAIWVFNRGEDAVWGPSTTTGGNRAIVANADAWRVQLDVSCPPPGYSFCLTLDGDYDWVAVKNLDLLVQDTTPPRVDALGGSLLEGVVAHGLADLQIAASDQGSGIRTVNVAVNGERIASSPTNCAINGTYATRVRPCPDFDRTIEVETERRPFREGQNTLRVCVSDVATEGGPPYSTCEQRTVTVDNSCPDSSGAGGEAHSISAGLENPATGKLARTRSVRSTDGVSVRGSLAGSGGPVRGASVCIYERVDEPAGIAQLVQVAKSRSDGAFTAHLPPGPSRVFQVAYRFGDRQIGSPTMYLESSVKPVFKVTRKSLRNGSSVGFRGRLPGPNAAGRSITLQARVGRKWRTFKQLQSNPRGRFTGKYRFTQTRGSVLYVFRALVKRQGGYPYAAGASRKAKVLVRG